MESSICFDYLSMFSWLHGFHSNTSTELQLILLRERSMNIQFRVFCIYDISRKFLFSNLSSTKKLFYQGFYVILMNCFPFHHT